MEPWLGNPIFLVFAFLTITSVTGTVAHYWQKNRRDELETALKQDMIQRGMSADDIVKVLQVTKSRPAREGTCDYDVKAERG
jgi:hypothetical protein